VPGCIWSTAGAAARSMVKKRNASPLRRIVSCCDVSDILDSAHLGAMALSLQMLATSFAVRPAGVACGRSQQQTCHAVRQPAAASRGCRWQSVSSRAVTTKRRRLAAAEAAADSAEVRQGGDHRSGQPLGLRPEAGGGSEAAGRRRRALGI
jgi:hypothetical protein